MPPLLRQKRPFSFRLATGWLLLLVAGGLLAPLLPLAYAPGVPDLAHLMEAPDWSAAAPHWLGTDPQGRDVLTELLYGARQLVSISLPAVALATLNGALLGGAAGFWKTLWLRWGWLRIPLPLEGLFQLAVTLLGAVPRLVLILLLAAGPAFSDVGFLLLLAVISWPEPARQVRAQMLQLREEPFVEAAYMSGLRPWQVWLRHALPHAVQPLRATAPLSLAGLIGLETTLAFLGIGRPPEVPSWGQELALLRQQPGAWWVLASVGGALLLTLLALQQVARKSDR
jgi:peptide/nickel transport system permease protein